MVVLAQALMSRAAVLLIDELSLGLAPVVVNRLVPMIRAVAESGAGVLLIEQFATIALGLANRAYIMEGGRSGSRASPASCARSRNCSSRHTCCGAGTVRAARRWWRRCRAAPHMTVTGIEHMLVLADDVAGTRDFYCSVLGLEIGDRPPLEFPGYWLYAGSTACVHIAERRSYAAHAAGLGMSVPERNLVQGPSTTSRSPPTTTTRSSSGSSATASRRSRSRAPGGRARSSSRTPTACASKSV